MKIEGVSSTAVRRQVLAAAGEKYDMAPLEVSNQVTRWLRGREVTPEQVSRIARRLGVDIVVEGGLRQKRGRTQLVLRLREGRSGEVMTSVEVALSRRRFDRTQQERLRSDLVVALAEYEALMEPDVPAEPPQPVATTEPVQTRREPRKAPIETGAAASSSGADDERPEFLPARYR